MSQTDFEVEEYQQENQEVSQSVMSSESIENGKEKFKIMIHKILGVADKKQIDKICCFFKINKQWSLTKQLFCAYSLFLTFFLVIVLGYFVFYLKFSPKYINDSILKQIDEQINENFNNSLQYFQSYSSWMIMFSQIFSNHVGWSTSLFETPDQMIIGPKERYFRIDSPIPDDLVDQKYSNKPPFNKKITLQTFSYQSLSADDQAGLSASTKKILNSVDILSYFFKNFIFDQSISNVLSLYLFIEERDTFCFFPGGLIQDSPYKQKIDVRNRPWYTKVKQNFEKNGKKISFTITGPYEDYTTKMNILTYSLPILKKDNPNDLAAIINVDIIINNFKSVYELISQKDNYTRIALIDYNSSFVINDCFKTDKIITFFDTSITCFTKQNWDDIKNFQLYPENSTFILKNCKNENYYISRALINDSIDKQSIRFMLIVFGEEDAYIDYRNETENKINDQISFQCLSIIITLSVLWAVSYFYIYVLSRHIVQPLAKLSNLAKRINQKDDRKNSTEDIKQQLDKISGADENTKKLIDSFINLVDQHSSIRKLANGAVDNYIPLYQKMNNINQNYPINEYKDGFEDVSEFVRYLKNFNPNPDEEEDDQNQDFEERQYQDINQNKDFDEGYVGNAESISYSSSHQDIKQNENDIDSADNLNNHVKLNNINQQENDNNNVKDPEVPSKNFAVKKYKSNKKDQQQYINWLKEQLQQRQNNEVDKIGLSQQILTSFLPQNTQSI